MSRSCIPSLSRASSVSSLSSLSSATSVSTISSASSGRTVSSSTSNTSIESDATASSTSSFTLDYEFDFASFVPKSPTCPICLITQSRTSDMVRHIQVHNPVKNWLYCDFDGCKYRTLQKSNLKTHERQHTGETPLGCPSCDYATGDPASLTKHRKSAHNYKPPRRNMVAQKSGYRQLSKPRSSRSSPANGALSRKPSSVAPLHGSPLKMSATSTSMDDIKYEMESEDEALGSADEDEMDVDDVKDAAAQPLQATAGLEAVTRIAEAELLLSLRFGN